MDLNYLYHRQGVSLFMTDHAKCARSRDAHRSMADGYAHRIADTIFANWPAAA